MQLQFEITIPIIPKHFKSLQKIPQYIKNIDSPLNNLKFLVPKWMYYDNDLIFSKILVS